MRQSLIVSNVMCEGCAGTITRAVSALPGVSGVTVDIPTGTVSFEAGTDRTAEVAGTLGPLGYPQKQAGDDLAALVAKAKGYAGGAPGTR